MTDLGSVSGASPVIADHYIFAIFSAVTLHEKPANLKNLCLLPLRHNRCFKAHKTVRLSEQIMSVDKLMSRHIFMLKVSDKSHLAGTKHIIIHCKIFYTFSSC